MKCRIISLVVLSATTPLFAGVTATWTGAEDSYWTNAANWLVEGAVPASCPGVVSNDVGGVFSPDLPTQDQAVFDGTCTSGRTVIDLSGLYSISKVTVTGADAPQYTFGTDTDDQILTFETNGVLAVDASVPAASCPVVNASVAIGNFDYSWWPKATIGNMLTVRNDSTGTLVFNSDFAVQRRRPGSSTAYKEFELRIYGGGNFRFNGNQPHDGLWLPTYYYYQTGTMEINADFCEQKRVNVCASSRVVIAKDATYGTYVGNNVGFSIHNGSTFTVEGDGMLRFAEHKGSSFENHGFQILNNGEMVVLSQVKCYSSNLSSPRVLLNSTSSTERRCLTLSCPAGSFPGGFVFIGTPQLAVGSTNALEHCSAFTVTNATTATFFWRGSTPGEALTVPINYIGAGSSVFTVENSGYEPFALASAVSVPDDAKVLSLRGTTAPIACQPTLSGGSVALRFRGEVVLPESASLSNCSLIDMNGAQLLMEGAAARTLPALAVTGGANVLTFTDQMTLTLCGVSVTQGTLNIRAADAGATIVFDGKTSADTPPSGLLLDGHVPSYSDDGRLVVAPSATDITIAARGDVVPNAPDSVVGIATAGSGGADALAADTTAVKALVQQTATPAEIALGDGQTLKADDVAMDYGSASLTIGTAAGLGTLASSSSSRLVLRNDSHAAPLTVKAKLADPDLLKTGVGEVVLSGGMDAAVGDVAFASGETVLSNCMWHTSASSKLSVTNGAVLVLGDGARLISDLGIAEVERTVGTVEALGGVLKICSGATVTNRIALNHSSSGKISAVHQTGGDVYLQGDTVNNAFLFDQCGGYAQGYWDMSGGTLSLTGRVAIAGSKSFAAIHQSGGSICQRNIFRLGAGNDCVAEFVMTGGTNTFSSSTFEIGDYTPARVLLLRLTAKTPCSRFLRLCRLRTRTACPP